MDRAQNTVQASGMSFTDNKPGKFICLDKEILIQTPDYQDLVIILLNSE